MMGNGVLNQSDSDYVFRKNVLRKVSEQAERSLEKLSSIWEDLGLSNDLKQDRIAKFEEHVMETYFGMEEEEEAHKQEIINRIESHLAAASRISQELGMQMPEYADQNFPLYQVEKSIRDDVRRLQKIKDERLHKFNELHRQEEELCFALGLRNRSPFPNAVPSEDQLDKLEAFVQEKTKEKLRLDAFFRESRLAICLLMQDIEVQPRLEFEKIVVDYPEQFRPIPQNISKLKDLHASLEQQAERARQQSTELREKLSYLWERLQIPGEERARFLDAHLGYTFSTIEALKKELKRCEALKSANIAVFVKQLRAELEDWWDKCCYSTEQRQTFSAFFSEEFTEDLLEIHEVEVSNLRQYYEDNVDIFQLAQRRGELWAKMKNLEALANDPQRLFHNRGGSLLKEERERRAIQKELPRIDQELNALLEAYLDKHGEPFLLHGENLLKVIHDTWDEWKVNKENAKLLRKMNRDQTDMRSPGRTLRTTPTANKIRKNTPIVPKSAPVKSVHLTQGNRKRPNTPMEHVSKRSKTASKADRSGPRLSVSRIRRFGKHSPHYQAALNSTREVKESRMSPKSRRKLLPEVGDADLANASVATSYSEFQEQLELLSAEKTCRSSVAPERYLRERNLQISPGNGFANGHSRVLSATKRQDTPGRLSRPAPLKTPRLATSANTPRKTPSTTGYSTPGRTRAALRSPAVGRSPLSVTKGRLTTTRGNLPIII